MHIPKDVDKWIGDSQELARFLEEKMDSLSRDNPKMQVYRTSLRRLVAFAKDARKVK